MTTEPASRTKTAFVPERPPPRLRRNHVRPVAVLRRSKAATAIPSSAADTAALAPPRCSGRRAPQVDTFHDRPPLAPSRCGRYLSVIVPAASRRADGHASRRPTGDLVRALETVLKRTGFQGKTWHSRPYAVRRENNFGPIQFRIRLFPGNQVTPIGRHAGLSARACAGLRPVHVQATTANRSHCGGLGTDGSDAWRMPCSRNRDPT